MIRMIQSRSARGAKKYFNDALQKSDYYLASQEIIGFTFHGKIAERIGIQSTTKDVFHALIENINPITGDKFTIRNVQNRTVAYDINFHCPKSVSLLHVLSKDDHILKAFQDSVQETMKDMEADSLVRVRKDNSDENRNSGELIWAEFIHQTARPVNGEKPDPHLHAHCYTFNVAWDEVERKFKAGQFRTIKRDMPFYQARFHKRLSDNLIQLGYRIRKTKQAFEIIGVPQEAIDLFSKRTQDIEKFAKENNITKADDLDKIGGRTRAKKQKSLTMAQLQKDWRKQIHDMGMSSEKANGTIIRHSTIEDSYSITSRQCVEHALQHHFERASVNQDRRILATAYRHSIGDSSNSVDDITKAFKNDKQIIHVKDEEIDYCTTYKMLEEEHRMIDLACKGKGKFQPLYKVMPPLTVTGEQADAVRSILTTKDQVSIVEGKAGTGKTTLMKEAVKLIEDKKLKVMVVAPTAQAARGVLKEEGFDQAETVAKLLADKKLQESLRNGVLWVDEAGLLGVADMTALLQIVIDKKARMILGGDRKQHTSVAYGDALRLLSILAGLESSMVNTIYRQKGKAYREAVQAISEGNIATGFQCLDNMGSIVEVDPEKPTRQLVKDYLSALHKGKDVLVVSPMHQPADTITADIRKGLKEVGKIGKQERSIKRLINLNLTEAEKNDIQNYEQGHVLQFNQNTQGIKRGSVWTVKDIETKNLILKNDEKQMVSFCMKRKKDFDVFLQKDISVAKNDLVRITRNSIDQNGRRLNNGQELKVLGSDKKQNIRLQNTKNKIEYVIDQNFGHINHAYCMTSHASQGKTVDEVLIYQPVQTFPATDLKQFYVSVSRGRESVKIYTDHKEELLNHVSLNKERLSASELLAWHQNRVILFGNDERFENNRHFHSHKKSSQRYKKNLFPD